MRPKRWFVAAAVLFALIALTLAACGSSSSSSISSGSETGAAETEASGAESEPGATEAEGSSGESSLAAAEEQVEEAYAGRFTEPPTKSDPAAKSMNVWFLSPGEASANASVAYEGAKEAAEKMGWNLTLFDGKLDPSKYPEGIRQAVAAGADGIISFAIDCPTAKSAYELAKKEGVKVVSELAFDCNEIEPGAESLFTAQISLGSRYKTWTDAYEAWGSDLAAWTIANTEGKANVINTTNEQYKDIADLGTGYAARMKECSECSVTEMPWTVEEAGAKLAAKVQAEILRDPEANALQNSANPQLGMAQGIVQSGKSADIDGVGGLGLPEDIALLKEESKGLSSLAAWPLTWWSWAAVDTMNSVFTGQEPEDSGLGWQMIDSEHNLPKGEEFEPEVDFRSDYAKRWGK